MRRPMSSVVGAVGEDADGVGLLSPPEPLEHAAADKTVAPAAMIVANLIHVTETPDTQFSKIETAAR